MVRQNCSHDLASISAMQNFPLTMVDQGGNGCHIHCSMWAADKNVFEASSLLTEPALVVMSPLPGGPEIRCSQMPSSITRS